MTASHGAELFWKPRPREAAVSWTLAMLANWCLMLQPTLVLWTQKVCPFESSGVKTQTLSEVSNP